MEKEYNKYLWSPKQPRVYGISPLTKSGTPMSEEDVATSLKVENSQQRFQQNPVVKRSEQWKAQQKQREEEIAASKKWLELHPEDESDSPYTILERGKHQAIVDGKDPSYYEKMIDDGKQFTKGALSVLSLPYLSAAAVGAYGYGASLGARGLFAAQGIHGLANENGVRKTANLIKSGDYGRAALSGAGDALNATMILPGVKLLGSVAKYGLKPAVVGDMLGQSVRYAPQIGGRLVVSQDYFKDPTKFYRIGTTPEKLSMEYAGENIVSGSAEDLGKVTPADAFRRTVTRNSRIQPGKGANEGYWVLAPEQSNTKVTNLLQKVNSSHGGETQASAGTLWEGGLNSDSRFPTVIFEGTMPETIRASWNSTLGKSIGRSTFVRQPSENLPIGTRLGFKTGEMPIHSTSSFVETSPGSGKFFYNGEIMPENRIFNSQQFSKSNGRTYLGLIERPSKLSEAELKGIPKSVRNQPYKPATWLQGDDAIKMFNDYGGMDPIVDNSPLMERIVKYVPEARERYGLVGNTNISDETIAKALYKRAFQLSGNGNGAVNEFGEPLVLFRGDTKRYPVLRPRMSPEKLATKSGTMDNSLGTLFLDYPDHFQGLDRYIGTARYFNGEGELVNSGTGSKIIGGARPMQTPPVGSRLLYSGVWGRYKYPISVYKLPASEMESGVNDINAFVVRSPKVRDATSEISVLWDDFLAQGGPGKNYYGKSKIVYDENGFPEFLHSDGTRTPALAGNENRLGMAEHYRYILNDAEAKQQGLLKSNKGSILRDEHTGYDYYALPNFNIRGAKHLLGYDLNYPLEKSWSLYRKQGGILKRVESGKSGIHIKPENRGKFTALKKRTGKSSTWYKEHGTPAQKKMAVFALNVKKWKHK